MPYAIEKIDTGERVAQYGTIPEAFNLPTGQRIVAPVAVGDEGLGYRMIEIVEVDFQQPGTYFNQGSDTEDRVGNVVTITRSWTPWTQQEIDAYETARLDNIAEQFENVDGIVRVAVLVIMDELNTHSTKLQAVLTAAANATSLATFQSAMASITPIPQRTAEQLKTAIRARLEP